MPLDPPYVTAALFCDKVIESKDNTISAIRIIDSIQTQLAADPTTLQAVAQAHGGKLPNPAIQVTGLFCVKAGDLEGKWNLRLDAVSPAGKRIEIQKLPIELHGADFGVNLVINLTYAVELDGIHWFELFFEDRVLTRVPLRITRSAQRVQGPPPIAVA